MTKLESALHIVARINLGMRLVCSGVKCTECVCCESNGICKAAYSSGQGYSMGIIAKNYIIECSINNPEDSQQILEAFPMKKKPKHTPKKILSAVYLLKNSGTCDEIQCFNCVCKEENYRCDGNVHCKAFDNSQPVMNAGQQALHIAKEYLSTIDPIRYMDLLL